MKAIDKICIIDDDEIYRFTAKKIIQKTEVAQEIISFENGQLAIDFFVENKNRPALLPEIILLDINMPVLNGWEFLAAYEKLRKELKTISYIFIVSSSVAPEDHKKATSSSLVSGFIVKPFTPEYLLTQLDKVLVCK